MNKAQLVTAIAEESGLNKKQVEACLKALTATVTKTLKADDKLQIPELGSFKLTERKERTVRNPRTGETMVSPACKVAKFTPAKALKDAVKEEKPAKKAKKK